MFIVGIKKPGKMNVVTISGIEAFLAVLICLPFATLSRLEEFDPTSHEAMELKGDQPYFDLALPTSYVAMEGQTVKLECAVKNLRNRQLVWQKPGQNPLTIGLESFYNTDRIVVEHNPSKNMWNLVIRDVRVEDEGLYECQVPSKIRHLRRHVQLVVKERAVITTQSSFPEIKVSGMKHVVRGQHIKLVCNATGLDHPPQDIDWFFNGDKMSSLENKIMIKKYVSITDRTISSSLEIFNAERNDSGVYVCRTDTLQITDIRVEVLNADTKNTKRDLENDREVKYYGGHGRSRGRQSGYSTDEHNGANGSSLGVLQHPRLIVYLSLVMTVLTYWLFPS